MSGLAESPTVSSVSETSEHDYKARRTAIGMSVSALAKAAGVDRGSLTALEAGQPVRDTTVASVEKTLTDLEHEMGMDLPAQVVPITASAPDPGFIRFKVEGVYGANALVIEGPVENIGALEAAVDRLLRRLEQSKD